jgi:shikimate kinase
VSKGDTLRSGVKDIQFLIIIGRPGAGKTWVGEVLSRRLGVLFLDAERLFLERYGNPENFLRNKPEALVWFELTVRERARSEFRTVIFEAGPFSQQDTVRRLQEDFNVALVSVDAPRHVRLARIRARAQGRHFIDDPEESVRHDDLYEREIKPRFDFAFHIDNAGLTEEGLVSIVLEACAARGFRLVGHPVC